LAVFEPPAVNATDELSNPHITAFIPHHIDDCQGDDTNGNNNNTNNATNNNNNQNSGVGSVMPPRSSDSLHFPSMTPKPHLKEEKCDPKLPLKRHKDDEKKKRKKDNGKGKEREDTNEPEEEKEEKKPRLQNTPVTPQNSLEKKIEETPTAPVVKKQLNKGALLSLNILIVLFMACISMLSYRKFTEV